MLACVIGNERRAQLIQSVACVGIEYPRLLKRRRVLCDRVIAVRDACCGTAHAIQEFLQPACFRRLFSRPRILPQRNCTVRMPAVRRSATADPGLRAYTTTTTTRRSSRLSESTSSCHRCTPSEEVRARRLLPGSTAAGSNIVDGASLSDTDVAEQTW